MSQEDLKLRLGINFIDTISLSKWQKAVLQILIDNFNAASSEKGNGIGYFGSAIDMEKFKDAANSFPELIPEGLKDWHSTAARFLWIYCNEQARLAALFSKVSSEISTYSPLEIQGYDFPDKNFLLTFDDGPSTTGDSSDKLISSLRDKNINGIFFLLGENLQKWNSASHVQDIAGLYAGMNVQLHGMTHESHAKSADWLQSVSSCNALVNSNMTNKKGKPFLFRQPYGERTMTAWEDLGKMNGKIMLWNIDSQDWRTTNSVDMTVNRCLMLMLLWRRGIILFHDIHEKAIDVIPAILELTKNAGLIGVDANKASL